MNLQPPSVFSKLRIMFCQDQQLKILRLWRGRNLQFGVLGSIWLHVPTKRKQAACVTQCHPFRRAEPCLEGSTFSRLAGLKGCLKPRSARPLSRYRRGSKRHLRKSDAPSRGSGLCRTQFSRSICILLGVAFITRQNILSCKPGQNHEKRPCLREYLCMTWEPRTLKPRAC